MHVKSREIIFKIQFHIVFKAAFHPKDAPSRKSIVNHVNIGFQRQLSELLCCTLPLDDEGRVHLNITFQRGLMDYIEAILDNIDLHIPTCNAWYLRYNTY